MCFGPLDDVPHTQPAQQKDKRAEHGGYTTNELAGGYAGYDCLGCPYAVVVKEVSDKPDEVIIQVKQPNVQILNCVCAALAGNNPWTNNVITTPAQRMPKNANKFLHWTFSGDEGMPPTEVRQDATPCHGSLKRSDWNTPGGMCGDDPDFPCAPNAPVMFRDSPGESGPVQAL